MLKIDDIDMLILSELSNDASVSIPKLAKKIRVNSSIVYARIKNMIKKNIVEKFIILVNDHEIGYDIKSLIGINMNSKMHESIVKALFEIYGVRKISEVTGRFDVLVTVYARTLEEMHKVISDKIASIDGILSSESFIEMTVREKSIPYKPKV
ncbi:MAG: transcriptional regulator [Cenarchaeum symbiont of Oopsacas minuta]|nr:transcriptional regulator [Cenarchaeum symbiont of Oopsacas minuta]